MHVDVQIFESIGQIKEFIEQKKRNRIVDGFASEVLLVDSMFKGILLTRNQAVIYYFCNFLCILGLLYKKDIE